MKRLLRFLVLVAVLATVLAGVPVVLVATVGWPLPSSLDAVAGAASALWRTGVAEATMVKAIAVLVWVVWIRLAAALVLQLAAAVTRRPVRRYRGLGSSQRFAAALLGSLTVLLASGGLQTAGAASDPAPVARPSAPIGAPTPAPAEGAAPSTATHWVVQPRDSLWKIAEQQLGDGTRWREIATANLGREVAPGIRFESVDQTIHAGWSLALPGTSEASSLEANGDSTTTVVVARGDSLSSIADRTLGDPDDWKEIWELNRGRSFDGVRFDDPNELRIGWTLEMPAPTSTPSPPPDTRPAAAPIVAEPVTERATADRTGIASSLRPQIRRLAAASPTVSVESVPSAVETGAEATVAPVEPSCIPAPIQAPASTADVEDSSNLAVGFGAATLLATGGLSLVASRRRQRLRAAAPGSRLPAPGPALIDLERALRAVSAEESMARLDLVMRYVFAALADRAAEAAPIGVIVGKDATITVVMPGSAPPAVSPFESTSLGWRLPGLVATTDIPCGSRFAAFPTPALTQIGRCAAGDVYLDLESLGVLGVESSPRQARAVLRALVAGLSVSPFAGQRRLLTVGLEHHVTHAAEQVVRTDDLDTAIEAAAMAVGPLLAVLPPGELAATLRSRSAGEPWEPVIVAVTAEHLPAPVIRETRSLGSPPGRGFALVSDAVGLDAPWTLRDHGTGWRLEPLGLDLEPLGLEAGHVAALAALVDDADAALIGPPTVDASRPDDVGPFREPEWQFIVRTLGCPVVQTRGGDTVSFTRTKSLELVAWLVRHRNTATRSGARAALWEAEVANGTFANVVSDARQSLAATGSAGEAEPWLERSLGERLVLHAGVVSDVELLEARLRHARRQRPAAARDTLTEGLRLVAGAPFAGSTYLWPDAEGHASQDSLLVATVAAELAELCLADGDLTGVVNATGVGLAALPGHETLLALRMRAHAATGDLSSVKREWAGYERIVANDTFGDGEPAPQLLQLRKELLGTRRAAPR